MRQIWDKLNIRLNRSEISGSLGDLGTFIPLAVGLVNRSGMNLGHILFFSGAMHLVTGLTFGIPMPVQPMKSIAAIAIAEGLDENSVIAAGIGAGLVLIILSVTGLIDLLSKHMPKPLVRGLQLAIGFKLIIKGVSMALESGGWIAVDSYLTGIICFLLLLTTANMKNFPGALIVFSLGGALLLFANPSILSSFSLGWEMPYLHIPTGEQFYQGFVKGTIPQIPLTILNSVIAVSVLSADLFPKRKLNPRKVALSVALMNLIACPLGGMPMCHGSGGLAAQYRFGARTAGSVVFLGSVKMIIAVLFGSSLIVAIANYPLSILGVLLMFSGMELALVCRDQKRYEDFIIMILTAGLCIAINIAVGFLIGLIVAIILGRKLGLSKFRIRNRETTKDKALDNVEE